jgi:hypothetical protein
MAITLAGERRPISLAYNSRRRRRGRYLLPAWSWLLAVRLSLVILAAAVVVPFGSQLADIWARFWPIATYDLWVIAVQLATPDGGFVVLSAVLLMMVPLASTRWLLAGDPPREILWLKNWPNGYRPFGYLDVPMFEMDYDASPVMQALREIGEDEMRGKHRKPPVPRYTPPSPKGIPEPRRPAWISTASVPADPAAPRIFDEGKMPPMVPTASVSN